jgi:hypothetical protein
MIATFVRQECREAFDLFDLDGSGEIDEQELKSKLCRQNIYPLVCLTGQYTIR